MYYAYGMQPSDRPRGDGPILSQFRVDADHLVAHSFSSADILDLEGIALLTIGTPLGISERQRSLVSRAGVIAQYPASMSELGNRGLEGVAIRRASDSAAEVAVVWEGGFPERRVPRQLDQLAGFLTSPLQPMICVHSIGLSLVPEANREPCRDGNGLVSLALPNPPDSSQRFRVPDLVWLPNGKGFLALLSSQNATSSAHVEYKYKWLQKFDRTGRPVGIRINLCSILPAPLRNGRSGNVEGLSWYDEGKSVVLVNDFSGPATVVILAVEPWPTTTSEACQ
jgi:hypothetical protein